MTKKYRWIILIFLIQVWPAFIESAGWHFGISGAAKTKIEQLKEESLTNASTSNSSVATSTSIMVFSESIPGSYAHSPDGTWWGYNQNKIVRFGDSVYMYVMQNDSDSASISSMTIYQKQNLTGSWSRGASFAASRPGNIVIDSTGVLHAFIFEPTTYTYNDSWGKLIHAWFSSSTAGNISSYAQETIIENSGSSETINIRVGASIAPDNRLAVGFGMNAYESVNQTEQLFVKNSDGSWQKLLAGTNLDHDYYYPFVAVSTWGFSMLPIQDDFTGSGNPNIYQQIPYFEYRNGAWRQEMIVDLTSHTLAASRPRLLEQSDLMIDSSGRVHIIYKEFLDSSSSSSVSSFKHLTQTGISWSTTTLTFPSESLNWLKLIEISGAFYYLGVSYQNAYLMKTTSISPTLLSLSATVTGAYPYLASPRGGTNASEPYMDILLLSGNSSSYPNAANLYLRIAKSEFDKL